MGALQRGDRVRGAKGKAQLGPGTFEMTATAESFGISGARYTTVFYLITFDQFPDLLIAVEGGEFEAVRP